MDTKPTYTHKKLGKGRVILKDGKEVTWVIGSVKNAEKEIEKLKNK